MFIIKDFIKEIIKRRKIKIKILENKSTGLETEFDLCKCKINNAGEEEEQYKYDCEEMQWSDGSTGNCPGEVEMTENEMVDEAVEDKLDDATMDVKVRCYSMANVLTEINC